MVKGLTEDEAPNEAQSSKGQRGMGANESKVMPVRPGETFKEGTHDPRPLQRSAAEGWDPPITKALGDPVVTLRKISKSFKLVGRTEPVTAIVEISLAPLEKDEGLDLDGKPLPDRQFRKQLYPIRRGEFVMIRGPSGGGKTTLLNIIGTLDSPTSGEVELCGKKIDQKSTDVELSALRLRTLGVVFQTFNLLATLSAYENVELPMVLLGKLNLKQRQERTKALLSRVGLQDRMGHLPSEMSGGEMQRTAIARAFANEPEVLLLDEPTGDLDTRTTVEIMDLLLDINQRGFSGHEAFGATCIMVTHNPDLECYADRIIYVRDGKIVRQVINEIQRRLDVNKYVKWLNESAGD